MDVEEDEQSKDFATCRSPKPKGWLQKRYILVVQLFLASFCLMCLRVDLSVAIVAMVNQTATQSSSDTANISETCFVDDNETTLTVSSVDHGGEFLWDKKTQGMILSSFFYGYILLQVVGGWIASRFSAKWTIGLALAGDAVLALFIPLAARAGYVYLMVVRASQGLLQGLLFPAMAALMAKWLPMEELVWLSSIRMMGASVGLVLGQFLAGVICEGPGWPVVFYTYGAMTLLWFLLWVFTISETPHDHPTISLPEMKYLEASVGKRKRTGDVVPWRAILTSPSLYALIVLFTAFDWFQFTILTSLPQYMNDVLRFPLSENGLLSAMPFVVFTLFMLTVSRCIDRLSRGRPTVVRKLSITIGFTTTSLFLFSLRYIGCDRILAVSFIVVAYSFQAFVQMVVSVAPLDLTRRYAGIVHGIGNTFSGFSGSIAPYVVGVLTQEAATREQWMIVFYICCVVGLSANLIFLIFGSSRLQSWDNMVIVNVDDATTPTSFVSTATT